MHYPTLIFAPLNLSLSLSLSLLSLFWEPQTKQEKMHHLLHTQWCSTHHPSMSDTFDVFKLLLCRATQQLQNTAEIIRE